MDYRKATIEDLDVLVTTRIEVLRAANKLGSEADMSEVEQQSRDYYTKALTDGRHQYGWLIVLSQFAVVPLYYLFFGLWKSNYLLAGMAVQKCVRRV